MKNTGALLKSKRESSNLSLSEVALATKINPKVLAAIENGDEGRLPAKTILKGFVRSYALFLKMDVDTVMRSFQEETGGPPPAPVTAGEPTKPAKNEASTATTRRRVGDESSSGMRTIAVVVIVVLIGLIIGVRELIEKYQRERVVEASADLNKATPVTTPTDVAKPTEATVPPAAAAVAPTSDTAPDTGDEVKIESATVDPKAATVDVKPVEVKPTEVKPAEPKPAETKAVEVKPAEPVAETKSEVGKVIAHAQTIMSSRMDLIRMPINNLVELRPTVLSPPRPEPIQSEAPEKSAVVASTPPPAAAAAPAPTPAPPVPAKVEEAKVEPAKVEAAKPTESGAKAAKNEIILEALDKVDVKFQVKGETKRVSLGPDQVHTLHVELPVTLDLSDGGAVNIILNGRERGVPGDLGKPKTIKIP